MISVEAAIALIALVLSAVALEMRIESGKNTKSDRRSDESGNR